MTKNTYMYKIHICICKYTPGLSRCIFTRGCIFAHVQINFYIYAIAFTCPKIHPGANYTYMYNIHPVCKSAHVNGAIYDTCIKSVKDGIFEKFLRFCSYFEATNPHGKNHDSPPSINRVGH